MKLFEHQDFDQLVLRAAEYFRPRGFRAAILEKDYYVTEALRIVAGVGAPVIFKGGTSLVKGWNLIDRFSEDVDIFLDPRAFEPPLGKRAVDRELKGLRDAVAGHPALTFVKEESQTIGGFGRNDRFSYAQRFGGAGEVANRVLVEAGTASGREPTTVMKLRSYLSEFLAAQHLSLGADDESSFPMDVIAMLKSKEYAAIKSDYDAVSREHFPSSYFWPKDMSFANSDALFPAAPLAATLKPEYEAQCKQLCYGTYPSWDQLRGRFDALKALL